MLILRQPKTLTELQAGIHLYERCYHRKYGTHPNEQPDQFFVAVNSDANNRIVGTIELRLDAPGRPFELETYFKCDLSELYSGPRKDVGEVGRLVSTNRHITTYLFCAATEFARKFNLKFFISFNKRFVTKIFNERHGFASNVRALEVRKERIPPKYASYFLDRRDPVQVNYGPVGPLLLRSRRIMEKSRHAVRIELPDSLGQMRQLMGNGKSATDPMLAA